MAAVGRFQVMATLQAARAQALGLSMDEAKGWGLSRAIFYAAAKRGFHRTKSDGDGHKQTAHQRERHAQEETYTLGGEEAYILRDRSDGLRFRFGDEEQTARDFDRQIVSRFPDWDEAWSEARRIIDEADPDDLSSQHRFFDHVYKPRRDTLAKRWSGDRERAPRAHRVQRKAAAT
jgi:hypothetical protein